MRTLFEITEAAKGIGIDAVTKEELYFAFLAEESLGTFSNRSLMRLAQDKPLTSTKEWRMREFEEDWRRRKTAGGADPKVYMGNNVPGNPEHDRWRKISMKILDKALKGELPNQKGEARPE